MMKGVLLFVSLIPLLVSAGIGFPPLVGDGVSDDTFAIQARLDAGSPLVCLPPPKGHYVISRTLRIRSNTELRLERHSVIRLAPGSNCPMAGNAGTDGGDCNIRISGGIWDMDNVRQGPNPLWQQLCDPPRPKLPRPIKYDPSFYRGNAFYFESVRGFRFSDVTIRNPVTYALQLCRVTDFAVEDVDFDFSTANPVRGNMDGVHLDGGCRRGRIARLRGTCYDDMVALNANDGFCTAYEGPISDIEIEDLEAKYGHSAVRMLSVTAPVERVRISKVRGYFYAYAIGFTHYFPERTEMGCFRDISISDVKVGKAPPLDELPWKDQMRVFPPFFYDENIRLENVVVNGFEILPKLNELRQ